MVIVHDIWPNMALNDSSLSSDLLLVSKIDVKVTISDSFVFNVYAMFYIRKTSIPIIGDIIEEFCEVSVI